MAKELGGDAIRVNAICPGIVDTSRMDDMHAAKTFDSMVATQIPLRRAGTGADIAAITVFLCSDQGSWISGQQWNVDGGMLTIH
jgi:3-oxoacyl-[acyl-carrier protein] reductase